MTAKTYGTLVRIIAVALAVLVAVGIVRQWSLLVPLAGVMVALIIANVARRFVKEVMNDERSRRVDEQAAALTYRTFTIVMGMLALAGMVLRGSLPPWATTAAETLAYAVCGLMVLHRVVSGYYGRKS